MTVRIDLERLLRGDNLEGLPFSVKAWAPNADPVPFLARVQRAIGEANLAANRRSSDGPLWSSDGDLVGSDVHAAFRKGERSLDELRRWFADLDEALDGVDVVIASPDQRAQRVPNLEAWRLPPAATAFLKFTADVEGRRRRTPRRVVEEAADALAAWTLPAAMTVVGRGTTAFVVLSATAAQELRTSASVEDQHSLRGVTKRPRRARLVDFTFEACGSLQVLDADRSSLACLPDLLAGLRVLAPYVDYAWVRRARAVVPSERDTSYVLGRPTTEMEEDGSSSPMAHYLGDYAIDAYVAQVLTSAHLARAHDLDDFTVESVGRDRHLVVARDPAPWLTDLNPDPVVLERARRGFDGALLTSAVIAANQAAR